MEKAKGARGNPGGRGARIVSSRDTRAQKTLKEMGISYDQSSKFQKLAACLTTFPAGRIVPPYGASNSHTRRPPPPIAGAFLCPNTKQDADQLRPGVGEYNTRKGNQPALPCVRC